MLYIIRFPRVLLNVRRIAGDIVVRNMHEGASFRAVVSRYISLTKPGVLFGNVVTGVAGFCLASAAARAFHLGLLVATIIGMTLVIASACALNNVLDRDIDKIMTRTKKRAVASGAVRPVRALAFSVVLGVAGLLVLALWTSALVAIIGAVGFVVYVWLYGALSKRRSLHGTLVGSISGAAPILAGYVAAHGGFDIGAVLVFLALFFWQFPEFFSIAIYRQKEYQAARIPVITVVKGVAYTKIRIVLYAVLFVVSALLLTVFGYTHLIFAVGMAVSGGYWLVTAFAGLRARGQEANDAWARRLFHQSINMLLLYSLLISIGPLLP